MSQQIFSRNFVPISPPFGLIEMTAQHCSQQLSFLFFRIPLSISFSPPVSLLCSLSLCYLSLSLSNSFSVSLSPSLTLTLYPLSHYSIYLHLSFYLFILLSLTISLSNPLFLSSLFLFTSLSFYTVFLPSHSLFSFSSLSLLLHL